MEFITVPLSTAYNRTEFDCGNTMLNNYLQQQARQDVKRNLAACFVLPDDANNIKGFYTLSNAGIQKDILPGDLKKKLPLSYINLPATLLGRLAVNKVFARQGIGELILIDALKRSYYTSLQNIASMAVIVDPIDENAIKFYRKYGFVLLPDSGKMFLPMKTISTLFEY